MHDGSGESWPWSGATFRPAVPLVTTHPDADLAGAFARCFSGRDGARVLEHLRTMTLERALGPHNSKALLRHLEGQRALVVHIEALVRRGRDDLP